MVRLPPITTEQRNRFIRAILDIGTRRHDHDSLVELQNLLALAPNIDDGFDQDKTDEFQPGAGWGKNPHPTDTMPQELGMKGPLADKLPAPNLGPLKVDHDDMKPPGMPRKQ